MVCATIDPPAPPQSPLCVLGLSDTYLVLLGVLVLLLEKRVVICLSVS